ncbi:MAG: polysaccharide deacetylase family protein [Lutibacter sp.]
MKGYIVKTPEIVKKLFYHWNWQLSKKEKVIYLTFDDGPTPQITQWVLQQLKAYNAKATFFCIGKNVKKHPKLFEEIINQNHHIGNHTHDHLNGFHYPNEFYLNEVLKAEEVFKNSSENFKGKLFRPPYGKLKLSQGRLLRKNGFKIVMWDVLSGDFDTKITNEKCFENVIKGTNNGSIIVFHDSAKATKKVKYALPRILEYYDYLGYQFKAIPYN